MKLFTILTSAALLFLGTSINAQDGALTIKFDETVHDFGNIDQKAGPQTCDFYFTNTGTTPIIIQNVSASCGCTTPGWSKEPIAPGARGFVKATYNPSGVMPFDKSLTVYSNAKPSPMVLRIKGRVVAQPPTTEEQYPQAFGALRLRNKELSLARVSQGAVKRDSIEIINTGDEPLKLTFTNVPKYIKIDAPATLNKGEKGFIRCTFNTATAKPQVWGVVKQPVNILINGKAQANAKFTVAATVEDDFSKLTPADYEQAPAVAAGNASYNFNAIKLGETITAEYEVVNTGKSPLIIRQSYAECTCLKVTAPVSIKPGEKAVVKAVLNTAKEEAGDKFYTITLVTNAPSQSTTILMLTGKIE